MMPSLKSLSAVLVLALLTASPLLLARCNQATPRVPLESEASDAHPDIVETAMHAGQFDTLVAALKAAGLVETLQGKGPFTVFAPTDEAFAKLPAGTLDKLLLPESKAQLAGILAYHVVPGKHTAKDVARSGGVVTVNGQMLQFTTDDSGVKVGGARVAQADIHCRNGVIHVIDRVLLPATTDVIDTARKAGRFKTLLAAIDAGGLTDTLQKKGPFTVFVPTDEAFAKLPEGTVEDLLLPENRNRLISVLKLHVVSGRVFSSQAVAAGKAQTLAGQSLSIEAAKGGVTVEGAKVQTADVNASNGVIHVIDKVLLPKD